MVRVLLVVGAGGILVGVEEGWEEGQGSGQGQVEVGPIDPRSPKA